MIDFIKKTAAYTAASTTLFISVFAAAKVALTWQVLLIVPLAAGVICGIIAWFEVFHKTGGGLRLLPSNSEDVSIALTVKRAISRVQFAPNDDESIAHEANKVVRRELDKHCIKYKDYKLWRKKNPTIFTAVVDDESRLIGFFDVFPLADSVAQALRDGKLHEHDLTVEAILPCNQNSTAKNIYIASIIVNPNQKSFSQLVAKELVLIKFAEFLTAVFPPVASRILFAFAHKEAGERLLKNANFRNIVLRSDNKQGDPLYELSPSGYEVLAENFRPVLKEGGRRLRKRIPKTSVQSLETPLGAP